LRHSLAANAFALGMPPNEVARLLRHASTKVTMAVYDGVVEAGAVEHLRDRLVSTGFGR
jgi:integrase